VAGRQTLLSSTTPRRLSAQLHRDFQLQVGEHWPIRQVEEELVGPRLLRPVEELRELEVDRVDWRERQREGEREVYVKQAEDEHSHEISTRPVPHALIGQGRIVATQQRLQNSHDRKVEEGPG